MSNVKYDESKYKLIMPEKPIRDGNLSLKARGLLALINTNRIFAKHDKWHLYESQVVRSCHADGRTSVQSAFKELEQKGYLEKRQKKDKNGQFLKGTIWIVHNSPHKKHTQKRPKGKKSRTRKYRYSDKPDAENLQSGLSTSNYYQQQLVSTATNINNNYNQRESSSSMAPQEAPDDEDDSVTVVKSDKHLKSKAKSSNSESAKKPNDTRKSLNRELRNNGRQARQQMSKVLPMVYDMNGVVKDIRFIRNSAEYKTRKREWEMLGASPQAIRSSTIKAVRNAKVRTVHSILNYVDKCLSALTD